MFGYMRGYSKNIGKELPTNDLILLFAEWLSFTDRWEKDHSYSSIEFLELKANQTGSNTKGFATCVGEYIIQKGANITKTFPQNHY